MEILQGQYLNGLKTGKGRLKALQIETEIGLEIVRLPKLLRAIAQQELTLGDTVRLWVVADTNAQKRSKKEQKKSATQQAWKAIQLIPLSPQLTVTIAEAAPEKALKKSLKKRSKSSQKSQLTVQVCQKKNCCRRGGTALWAALKTHQTRPQNAISLDTGASRFKLEPVGCLGECKRGPNIRILPDNVKYRSVQSAELDQILQKHR